ncbi:MAG TPA: hypothetical protein VFN94_09175, partial [Nitrospiria bacterium]|nr:hypothetical protein [Nitrospiria bacterium]
MSGRVDAWWLPRSGARVLAVTIGAAALAAIATVSAWPRLAAAPQPYSDLVAGMITWSDYPKSSEYVAAAWFFAAFVFAWPILSRLANQLPWPERGAVMIETPAVPYALYLGIATYAAAFGLVTRRWPWFPLAAALVLPAAWAGLTRGSTVIPAIVPAGPAFVALLVAVVCAYFSLLGVLAAMDAVIPTWFAGHTSLWSAFALTTPFIFACGLVLGHRRFSPATWRAIASGSQIPLPLLITVLAHDAYLHDGLVTRLNMPTMTKAGVLVFAAAMCAREMIAWRRAEPWLVVPDANRMIRPSSVVWIAAFLAYRVPEFSGFEWDSLHLGELLLPWHQVVTHDRALFDQFVPAQGGMSLLYGAVNTLALDGAVSSFPIAVSWLSVAAAAGAAWTVCRLGGPGWALLLAPFLPTGYTSVLASFNRFFLALPILAVLAHPTLLARPRRWLMAWAGLSMVHVLYNAIVGLACTAATAPVAAWMAVRARTPQAEIAPSMITPRRTAMMFAIGGLGAALAPSLGAYLLGLARFVIENAPTNTTAFGVGVLQAGRVPDWFWWHDNKLAWELIRIGGWVGGAIALVALAVHQVSRQRRGDPVEPAGVVITLTGVLFLLALIPYSLGQVWPDELSRSGAASMLAIGGLLPLAIILTRRPDPRAALIAAGVIGALLGVRGAFGDPNPWQIAQRAIAAIDAPARTVQRSGAAAGVPNAGEGFVLPDKLDAIQRLNAALRRLLRDGETYLDLTNRPALYFVLDRPVPAPYPDDYNAP